MKVSEVTPTTGRRELEIVGRRELEIVGRRELEVCGCQHSNIVTMRYGRRVSVTVTLSGG